MLGDRPIYWIADWLCKWKVILNIIIVMLTIIVTLESYCRVKHLCEKPKVFENSDINNKGVSDYGILRAHESDYRPNMENDASDSNVSSNDLRNRAHQLKSPNRTMLPRLPGAIIIGARKCGTRALLKFLELNTKVKVAQNEIHFFDKTSQYSKGLDWYRRQMPYSNSNDVTIEKSPAYFITSVVPHRMKEMNSTIRLILIVRDPVVRLISDYTQVLANKMLTNRSSESDSQSFERYLARPDGGINANLRAVKTGMYAIYLEHWRKFFNSSQILIVEGERLIKSPYDELKKVERFLGVPPMIKRDQFVYNATKGFYCIRHLESPEKKNLARPIGKNSTIREQEENLHPRASSTKCLSPSKGRKHIKVEEKLMKKLRQLYYPSNQYFYSMIGQRFDWPE